MQKLFLMPLLLLAVAAQASHSVKKPVVRKAVAKMPAAAPRPVQQPMYPADSMGGYHFTPEEVARLSSDTAGQSDYGDRLYEPRLSRFISVDPSPAASPGHCPRRIHDKRTNFRTLVLMVGQ